MGRNKRSKCQSPMALKTLRPGEEEEPQTQSRNEIALQIQSSTFKLPRDWIVKKVRRTSGKSCGLIDKYYYEPETGQQFRSLRSIQRYLTEKMDDTPKYYHEPGTGRQFRSLKSVQRHLLETNECADKPSQNSEATKKNKSSKKVETSASHFIKPPKKVNWVLSGPGGDVWSPYINASAVPESIKQTWAKIFMLYANEKF